MQRVITTLALLLAATTAPARATSQADRYFELQSLSENGQPARFVVRISEEARARPFAKALRDGQARRLTSRIVQRPADWNRPWPFYSERHRLLDVDTLVTRCPTHSAAEQAEMIGEGAQMQGSAWCPVVRVVREIRHPAHIGPC